MESAIPLRAHNLLCLLGYRGRGYSPAFVAAMDEVHRRLTACPDTPVLVRTAPDRLCAACPNLAAGGCALGGSDHEAHMRWQDEEVARRLGVLDGSVHAWSEILSRVATSVRGAHLPAICTTCPWLPLGWCAEGVERLAAERRPEHRDPS